MKFSKKKVIAGAVIVAVIGAVAVSAKMKGKPNAGMSVSTSEVLKKDIQSSLSLKAPLEGTESVEVVSRLHYEILSINVKEGDKVEKGQTLAVLDTTDLKTEVEKLKDSLQLLQIQYNEGKNSKNTSALLAEQRLNESLEESQRKYEAAQESYKAAKNEYENTKVLFSSGMESQATLTAKESALNDAKRNADSFNVENGKVKATEAQLMEVKDSYASANNASGAKSIEIAKKDIARKQKDLEDCIVKSTINGTVTRVNAKVGRFADEINEKKPMFVIENIDKLKMMVNVSEYDIDKLEIGQTVKISADILKGETVDGIVSRISPTGEQKTGTNERVIPIQIDISDDTKGLIAGINATAKIETEKAVGAIVIPSEALIYNNSDDTYSIFVLREGNVIEKMPVKLGVEDILEVQVISDKLVEGDKVILNPDASLTDGMSVIVSE